MLVLAIAAIVVVPLAANLMGHVFDRPAAMSPLAIARIVVVIIVLPLVAGMIIRRLLPRVAEWLQRPVRWVATGLLLLGVLAVLAGSWSAIWAATGSGTIIAIVAFVVIGLLVGHLLGGPDPEHASVLALSTGCRHRARRRVSELSRRTRWRDRGHSLRQMAATTCAAHENLTRAMWPRTLARKRRRQVLIGGIPASSHAIILDVGSFAVLACAQTALDVARKGRALHFPVASILC